MSLVITIRDFSLLDGVSATLTSRDRIEVHNVSWSVDEDNAEWALVRADAIHAALLKGRDYAAALGGTIVRVDHVADAGLLGSSAGTFTRFGGTFAASAAGTGGDDTSMDPVPQVLGATIEARFTAVVSTLPAQ